MELTNLRRKYYIKNLKKGSEEGELTIFSGHEKCVKPCNQEIIEIKPPKNAEKKKEKNSTKEIVDLNDTRTINEEIHSLITFHGNANRDKTYENEITIIIREEKR